MGLLDKVLGDDVVLVRQYLATVIGALRAPYGQRSSRPCKPGEVLQLALNKTTDRVLFLTVTRADSAGQALAIFSSSDSPSTNDFVTQFANAAVFRFTLRPGERLSLLNQGATTISVVVAQEAY